jgi:hypothetical protein
VVLPILEDFKPDIIINSAGQDNHFSDPITNMNFSAQGYAALTELLSPNIAVLEGGYAIEGALPYVNLGIILAMAGIDYSKIKEPNYDPERLRQKPEISRWIQRTGDQILSNWRQRDKIKTYVQDTQRFAERTRSIYYDTDNITEKQAETLRICSDCSGVLQIDSSTDGGRRILAVHIPTRACNHCKELGYEWFDAADKKKYNAIYLQDRPEDHYDQRKRDF